jgi:CheY-like chemotaxis protein/PAS domain-containing protein
MSSANGTLGEIIKALDIAGVEMLALGLPENRIIDASRRLALTWQCSKYEIVGHVLATNAGKVHARYVDTDGTGANVRGGARIEVTLERIDRPDAVQRFRPHYLRDGSDEFLLLLAEAAAPADHEREETLARITEAAGYDTFEVSAETGEVLLAAPFAAALGLPEDSAIPLADWQTRVHPDDAAIDPAGAVASGGLPLAVALVRLRDASDAWLRYEFLVQAVRPAPGAPVTKLIGLVRPWPEPAENALAAVQASVPEPEREDTALAALGVARFAIDPATGSIDLPPSLTALVGLDAHPDDPAAALAELAGRIAPADYPAFEAALTEAAQGLAPAPLTLRTSDGDRCFRLTFAATAGGAVEGYCQDITGFAPVAPAAAAAAELTPQFAPVLREMLDHLRTADAGDARDADEIVTLASAVEGLRLQSAPAGPVDDAGENDEEAAVSGPTPASPALEDADQTAAAPTEASDEPPSDEALAAASPENTPPRSNALAPPLPPETLPDPAEARARPAPQAYEPSFDVRHKGGAASPRALVVDDDATIRAVIVAMLDDIGLPAIEASDGAEGLAKLRRAPTVSLVVSDVVMEGVGGPEFLAEAFLERPDLRAILTSGYDLGVLLADVDLPDGIELMPKPFTRQEFLHKVETLLAPAAAA